MFKICNIAILMIVAVLWGLTGCTPAVQTTPMAIDETRYEPAVESYPASVGIYFPDDFFENNFYNETNDGHHHTFHNNPADATWRALNLSFETIFSEVRYLETLQEGLNAEDLAFVVVPNIVSMTADLAPEVIAVKIVYEFEFFADSEHLYSWRIYGRDSLSRPYRQMTSTLSGSVTSDIQAPAISPEKFDAVARRAVWDAVSVLLTELDRQKLLADRIPTPLVNTRAVDISQQTAADQVTLAMVGPIFDQGQEPEKQRLEDCLLEEIKDNGLPLKAVPLHSLRNRLYPWLTRSNYPKGLNELKLIIQEPAVKERLAKLGVQYVLNWDGETTLSPVEGHLYMTPYGIIGYNSADKTSVIKADLLAVKDGRVVTSFESVREGTNATLGLVVIPLPITTDTEEEACEELTRQIDYFIQINTEHQQQSH